MAIGARTTESQVHRELASGLSMPVGFKNSTDGSTQIAVDAVLTARSPHWFPSVTKQGVSAIFQTIGNDTCHVILRGGTRTGPNYDAEHVAKVCARLAAKGLRESVMVDCSHGNSLKDHTKQADVAASICEQVAGGLAADFRRDAREPSRRRPAGLRAGQPAVYGQSITDACLSLEQTEPLLEQLAAAQRSRERPLRRSYQIPTWPFTDSISFAGSKPTPFLNTVSTFRMSAICADGIAVDDDEVRLLADARSIRSSRRGRDTSRRSACRSRSPRAA